MNKQQLAAKIWESANRMRSKIEANEYKDYILGFIFYKFLSDQEVKFLKKEGWIDEDLPSVREEDGDTVNYVQKSLGYFIAYNNLFSTWLGMGSDFDVSKVRKALSAFNRLLNASHKKLFENVFYTLDTGLSKLGDSSNAQTKAVSALLHLIKDIPMDGRQDYDVLGFIYEYLISNFAANAGKKAGEFYTPHEVSLLMSEIVAHHLRDRQTIEIYDPTSGSGSLLINIGKAVAKHMNSGSQSGIKYYAQELKENTYNLTRMNLIMRGILPDNIVVRNGDTLGADWPCYDSNDSQEPYKPLDADNNFQPLSMDAVVSNPPYSQKWEPQDKKEDERYARFGLAPASKADYAFLLHDLFHVKPDGIMTIVLPHGVLFRGGEEGEIRRNLLENNHIDAVIGLPANIFFGTGIPTIIMVLKRKRERTDVLIVDASKGFEKVGKNNRLRASDIKKIADAVTQRLDIAKFSRSVSLEEIRSNDYNLNIPRYVDSAEPAESWDIYASMFGGIPENEIAAFAPYWAAFPGLKEALFVTGSGAYVNLNTADIKAFVREYPGVNAFRRNYTAALAGFSDYLKGELRQVMDGADINKEESVLSADLFRRLADVPLVNVYEAYQILDERWQQTAADLEIIQTEGLAAAKQVDPRLVIKKKEGKESEVQEGWLGHIIPFELVQALLLPEDLASLRAEEGRLDEIRSGYEALFDALDDEGQDKLLNDDNDAFDAKAVSSAVKDIYKNIATDDMQTLQEYLRLTNKKEKLAFAGRHSEIAWEAMEANKDGTYSKSAVSNYISQLRKNCSFAEGTFEYAAMAANALLEEEKNLKKQSKARAEALHIKTKEVIEGLDDVQVCELLYAKWIDPLLARLLRLPDSIIADFVSKLEKLASKYAVTLTDVEEQIADQANQLVGMLEQLTGNEFDMRGIEALRDMLRGSAQ
ncbi:MAG: type I restriction-modification system subunit M [bacterium]|nr:type I restriction-modification system subunit M [bacterium]